MREKKLNNKGFSLVEIIIVVAIMAILAAVLAPMLIKYIEKSRKNVCQNNMGLIDEAITLEFADERENFKNYGEITDLSSVKLYDGSECPGGGTYKVTVTALGDGKCEIDIECSKHGAFEK